jgi:hypothetical protein
MIGLYLCVVVTMVASITYAYCIGIVNRIDSLLSIVFIRLVACCCSLYALVMIAVNVVIVVSISLLLRLAKSQNVL